MLKRNSNLGYYCQAARRREASQQRPMTYATKCTTTCTNIDGSIGLGNRVEIMASAASFNSFAILVQVYNTNSFDMSFLIDTRKHDDTHSTGVEYQKVSKS
jgi:hypothetical protein